MGELVLILGPMFAQKTTYLRNQLIRPSEIGQKILYINYQGDTRDTQHKFSTHNIQLTGNHGKFDEIKLSSLGDIDLNVIKKYDIIGIDEGQFFHDVDVVVRKWVIQLNKKVYLVSLNGDYHLHNIGEVWKLIPICSNIIYLRALCYKCGKKAIINDAICSSLINQPSTDLEKQEIIGGSEKYIPLCLKCFHENI